MPKVSVTILTKNSSKHIKKCLDALSDFDDVVVLDNGSTDDTIAIAEGYQNVRIFHSEFIGFGPLKNLAASHAASDWVFSVDSDEVVTPELARNVLDHQLNEDQVGIVHRLNHYKGRLINGCGWQDDLVMRLYDRKVTSYGDDAVHESIRPTEGGTAPVDGNLLHYSYDCVADLIDKMQLYSTIFAESNQGTQSSSTAKAVVSGFARFFKDYFLKKGLLYGVDGFTISTTNAGNSFFKYLKLHEANKALLAKNTHRPE